VTEQDLKFLNASFIDPIKFATLVSESNAVTFYGRHKCLNPGVTGAYGLVPHPPENPSTVLGKAGIMPGPFDGAGRPATEHVKERRLC
jgi:hypothetical protein